MSNQSTLKIDIPLDKDGFLEMECDFCKNRFMLHKDVYVNEDNLHFFCPICGLPNATDTFFCPEVLEKAQQIAANYAMEQINAVFDKSFKGLNKSGFVKVKTKKAKPESEKELYKPAQVYEIAKMDCCDLDVKIQNFDKEIGVYCPVCGGAKI